MDRGQIASLLEGGYELIQTHISWVLLGRSEVYKIKKPLKFSFLDFSTLEKRGFFCAEEVRLNRRLAEDVYKGVEAVIEAEGGYSFGGKGRLEDYAVRMRRLDGSKKMDRLLKCDGVSEKEVEGIAGIVADFHAKAGVSGGDFNSPQLIGSQIGDLGNLRDAIERASGFGEWVDRILRRSELFIKRNEKLLRKRIEEGFVRDCHGDLHSGNVFFDGGIKIIDCIEFSRDFRCIDVVSDIAFMAMDLEYNGRADLSEAFMGEYAARTGDEGLELLLPFYKCYRANVRAKIAAIEWMQKRSQDARERIDRYVLLAEKYSKTL
jgi:hypothetical protein